MYEILLVDDESDNVEALGRLFRKDYIVHKALSGIEALKILENHPQISLILTDQRMPEMTGVELLKKSIKTHPHSFRILLTGYTDIESIVESINSGEVYRYLSKPWDPIDLKNTIDKAVEKFRLRKELVEKNAQLELALGELKTLDQAKTNFMILINHELKTPLTIISSFLDLLKESDLNDEQKLYVDRIDKSRLRLHQMVEASMDLISAETGKVTIQKKSIKTRKVADEIFEEFQNLKNHEKYELLSDITEGSVKIDIAIVKKVANRLLDNAIKFTPDSKKIELNIQNIEGTLHLLVKNQGPHLNKETINKILKPFSIDGNIMNHSQGLGLGLNVCQALLKAHGSQLNLESTNGIITASFPLI